MDIKVGDRVRILAELGERYGIVPVVEVKRAQKGSKRIWIGVQREASDMLPAWYEPHELEIVEAGS